jgi:biopolymer transport protein ExbD
MSLRKKFSEDHAEVDTGPLNDILFILMFFFLIISTLANPNVIKMSTPKGKSDTKAKQSVIVSIDKNRTVYVGQRKIVFDSLEAELRLHINAADSTKPGVVINADSLVAWKDIVKIIGVAKKLGATASGAISTQ